MDGEGGLRFVVVDLLNERDFCMEFEQEWHIMSKEQEYYQTQ